MATGGTRKGSREGLILVGGEVKGPFVGSTVVLVVLAAAAVNDGIRDCGINVAFKSIDIIVTGLSCLLLLIALSFANAVTIPPLHRPRGRYL